VKDNASAEWKFSRVETVLEFVERIDALPPPFSMLHLLASLAQRLRAVCRPTHTHAAFSRGFDCPPDHREEGGEWVVGSELHDAKLLVQDVARRAIRAYRCARDVANEADLSCRVDALQTMVAGVRSRIDELGGSQAASLKPAALHASCHAAPTRAAQPEAGNAQPSPHCPSTNPYRPSPLPNPLPNPSPNPLPNPSPNPLPNPSPNPLPNPSPNPYLPNPLRPIPPSPSGGKLSVSTPVVGGLSRTQRMRAAHQGSMHLSSLHLGSPAHHAAHQSLGLGSLAQLNSPPAGAGAALTPATWRSVSGGGYDA